jgi:hypothetical protein
MASRLLPLRFPVPWMSAFSVVKTHHRLNPTPYDLSCASSLKNPAEGEIDWILGHHSLFFIDCFAPNYNFD